MTEFLPSKFDICYATFCGSLFPIPFTLYLLPSTFDLINLINLINSINLVNLFNQINPINPNQSLLNLL